MAKWKRAELRALFAEKLSPDDLRNLAFDLEIDDTDGLTLHELCRYIIKRCEQQQKESRLTAALQMIRPDVYVLCIKSLVFEPHPPNPLAAMCSRR